MQHKALLLVVLFFISIAGIAQSKLGEVACVYVTSPNLDSSVALYEKIGFPKIASNVIPVPWAQVSDGSLLIMMRKDTGSYVGLTYYASDVDKIAAQLEKDGIMFTRKPKEGDQIKRYYFKSPEGLNIMLASNLGGFTKPKGITMLDMGHEDIKAAEKYPNKQCGVFGEFSLPVINLDKSIEYWNKLGFEVKTQMVSPYPWAILTDGLMLIGLHQTEDFDFPAVTYFGLDTEKRVQQLREKGIANIKETILRNNFVLTTWEGLHVFLFAMVL
jgi:hypothetical protein